MYYLAHLIKTVVAGKKIVPFSKQVAFVDEVMILKLKHKSL